jgi:hypothetical protein
MTDIYIKTQPQKQQKKTSPSTTKPRPSVLLFTNLNPIGGPTKSPMFARLRQSSCDIVNPVPENNKSS